jgi:hypothetical protein
MTTGLTDLLRSRPAPGAGGGDLLPNYWNPQRLDPEIVLPSSYLAASVVFGNGAWGSWATVQAAAAADYVLLAAQLSKPIANSGSCWLQIGLGAAGAEVPIAELGDHFLIAGSGASPIVTRTYRLEPYTIPAGTRVAARGWHTVGNAVSRLHLSLIPPSPTASWYSTWPNTYIGGSRATNLWRSPAVAGWTPINGGAAAWSTVLAAAANDLLFNACEFDAFNGGGGNGNVVELAVGAAGSEQILSRVPIGAEVVIAFSFGYSEAARKGIIFAGERVSARLLTDGAGPWDMAFYFEDV